MDEQVVVGVYGPESLPLQRERDRLSRADGGRFDFETGQAKLAGEVGLNRLKDLRPAQADRYLRRK